MLFKPELATKVLAGEKTQTRRVKNLGEHLGDIWGGGKAVFRSDGRVKWLVGRTYVVQTGRGKPGIGRLRLLDIRKELLQDISEEDAKAELGAPDWPGPGDPPYQRNLVAVFSHLWDSINPPGLRFGHNPEVWVLVFEVAN